MGSDVRLSAAFAFCDLHIKTLAASVDLEEFRERWLQPFVFGDRKDLCLLCSSLFLSSLLPPGKDVEHAPPGETVIRAQDSPGVGAHRTVSHSAVAWSVYSPALCLPREWLGGQGAF